MRYEIILCPRQELNLRPAGLQPAALTKLSYRGETCAPTRIRAGGRRARSSGGGTRTRDPGLMKPMLYQLSYTRIHAANSAPTRYVTLPVFTFVPAAGIEPATPVLSGQCSHQLSYTGKRKQSGERAPAQHGHHVPLPRGERTNVASDRKEEAKPATLIR